MEHSIRIDSLRELARAAAQFVKETEGHSLIAFFGAMGAGKTTFTSAICHELGVSDDAVNSPTFSIVNEYRSAGGETIYHFDFYRITKIQEALDLGLYDYLDSGCLCLMEWPENIASLLPEETLQVRLTVLDDESRLVEWSD